MVKDAIMSHNTEYTRKIEEIFGAVSPEVMTLILETAGK